MKRSTFLKFLISASPTKTIIALWTQSKISATTSLSFINAMQMRTILRREENNYSKSWYLTQGKLTGNETKFHNFGDWAKLDWDRKTLSPKVPGLAVKGLTFGPSSSRKGIGNYGNMFVLWKHVSTAVRTIFWWDTESDDRHCMRRTIIRAWKTICQFIPCRDSGLGTYLLTNHSIIIKPPPFILCCLFQTMCLYAFRRSPSRTAADRRLIPLEGVSLEETFFYWINYFRRAHLSSNSFQTTVAFSVSVFSKVIPFDFPNKWTPLSDPVVENESWKKEICKEVQ